MPAAGDLASRTWAVHNWSTSYDEGERAPGRLVELHGSPDCSALRAAQQKLNPIGNINVLPESVSVPARAFLGCSVLQRPTPHIAGQVNVPKRASSSCGL